LWLYCEAIENDVLWSNIWMGGRKVGMWRHTDTTCVAKSWSD